ncbi:MAG: nitrilase family protein [Chloroflexi bacterium]|nr:nitrilase family protein [Chloroflexota bacterium]
MSTYPMERIRGQEASLRLAVVQMEVSLGEKAVNIQKTLQFIDDAAAHGVNLIVFPELCNTGYVFNSRQELAALAEPIPEGETVQAWWAKAADKNIYIVAGIAERQGASYYNSAVLVGPQGCLGLYRKAHLFDEEKLFFEPGDLGFPVFNLPFGNVGMLICYDIRFAEPPRILMLQGADLICAPTNWVALPPNVHPWDEHGYCLANYITIAQAAINQVFVACADRVGSERGIRFLGASIIAGQSGWPLAGPASPDKEELLYAEVNLSDARRAKIINSLNDTLRDRRIDLYDRMLGYTLHKPFPF